MVGATNEFCRGDISSKVRAHRCPRDRALVSPGHHCVSPRQNLMSPRQKICVPVTECGARGAVFLCAAADHFRIVAATFDWCPRDDRVFQRKEYRNVFVPRQRDTLASKSERAAEVSACDGGAGCAQRAAWRALCCARNVTAQILRPDVHGTSTLAAVWL